MVTVEGQDGSTYARNTSAVKKLKVPNEDKTNSDLNENKAVGDKDDSDRTDDSPVRKSYPLRNRKLIRKTGVV